MRAFCEIRNLHGNVFVTIFEDGQIIPWRLLTLREYIDYTHDFSRAHLPPACIEDEIFNKCVLDSSYKRQFNYLKAGTVFTVVQNIMQISGPKDIESFNNDLNIARSYVNEDGIGIFHEMVRLITLAFPYKPEEIYAMPYDAFLSTFALAEHKLLTLKIIESPLIIESKEKSPEQEKSLQQEKTKSKIDAKKLWEEQQISKPSLNLSKSKEKDSSKRWWKISPVLESDNPKKIDFDIDSNQAIAYNLDNDELNSPKEVREAIAAKKMKGPRDQMIKDAQVIYKDLIQAMENRTKK